MLKSSSMFEITKNKCICGVNVQIATKVFGWLFLAGNLGFLAEKPHRFMEYLFSSSPDPMFFNSFLHLGISIVGIVVVCLMLFGAHTRRPNLMIPFLIYSCILVVLLFVPIVISIVNFLLARYLKIKIMDGYFKNFAPHIILYAIFAFYAQVHFYFGLIVPWRAHKCMKEEDDKHSLPAYV